MYILPQYKLIKDVPEDQKSLVTHGAIIIVLPKLSNMQSTKHYTQGMKFHSGQEKSGRSEF